MTLQIEGLEIFQIRMMVNFIPLLSNHPLCGQDGVALGIDYR